MSRDVKYWLSLFGILAVATVVGMLVIARWRDTTGTVLERQFTSIRPGMTKDQVERIMDPDGSADIGDDGTSFGELDYFAWQEVHLRGACGPMDVEREFRVYFNHSGCATRKLIVSGSQCHLRLPAPRRDRSSAP
jgi:hypothetical protein